MEYLEGDRRQVAEVRVGLTGTNDAEILSGLEQSDPDLATLSRRYQQARAQDYFNSPLGQRVREALLKARGAHA